MKKVTILLNLLFVTISVYPQYNGGSDDGSDYSSLYGINLNGNIASLAVMYRGSFGDGHDQNIATSTLTNNNLTVFDGGLGDGFSNTIIVQTLSGENFAILYSGATGDGYTQNFLSSTSLAGVQFFQMYQGDIGDGFSLSLLSNTLLQGFITALYEGGDGDGFSLVLLPDTVLQGFMTELYEGGIGDGFALDLSLTNLLTGDLIDIYEGGNGDGYASFALVTTLTLDIVEELIKMNVLLYPNPATDIVNLKLPQGINITKIELIDINGRHIKVNLLKNNTIDVSNLPSGLYLMNIISETNRSTKKLIIK